MFANELSRTLETAPRTSLDAVVSLMWKAFGAGQITEAEAEALSSLIEARRVVPSMPPPASRKAVGSRPITPASTGRRRVCAASGRLPPALAAHFTQGETAVLAVIAKAVAQSGDCRRCNKLIAALAGVGHTTVKNALRRAASLGLITIEHRPQTAWRNNSNIVRIISSEWQSWNRMRNRIPPQGGGGKFATGTSTTGKKQGTKRTRELRKRLPKRPSQGRGDEPDENRTVSGLHRT